MLPTRLGSKKKDAGYKSTASHLLKTDDDDDIKAELEAMTGLEYNLHGCKDSQVFDKLPSATRKSRGLSTKESSKLGDKSFINIDKAVSKENKIEMEPSIPYLSSTVSISEVNNVLRQAGHTSEDRYKILEARDRLMRLKQARIHTLDTANVTIGTCPDMCPEKERLMREFQRQVASYELVECAEYKINHEAAVKQYSRSSADQEEPMPQDLRPVSSLKMTMSYLLHEIADLCDEEGTNLAEWYHFLWDRTRGIRKDITQQELCCIDTVELVEQCARFHIICSERLCAEELAVFDDKINTENLTKCLQTLKYMYHDLRVKGIACKNEPEFRAYIILLNLNDANFMWDLQRLPSSIQKSTEVNFAVRVYSSIQSNNYAKFFKLVGETTYLNACILLRYFFQVRCQALSVMVKAYCRKITTAYPLYEFMDILGFEDENEAIYFCEQAGLNISDDEMHIILNRQNTTLSPAMSNQGRARNLVESKRIAMGYSIGQAVAGGVMPDQFYINHKPHNSFDSDGYLKSEAINAKDQSGGTTQMEDDHDQNSYEYMDEDMPAQVESSPIFPPVTINSEHKEKTPINSSILNIFSNFCEPETVPITTAPTTVTTTGGRTQMSFSSSPDLPEISGFCSDPVDFRDEIESEAISSQNQTAFAENDTSSTRIRVPFTSNNGSLSIKTNTASNNIFSEAPGAEIFARPMPILSEFSSMGTSAEISNIKTLSKTMGPAKSNVTKLNTDLNQQVIEMKTKQEDDKLHALQAQEIQREKMLQLVEERAKQAADYVELQVIHNICLTILKEEMEKMRVYDRLGKKIIDDILDQFVLEECKFLFDDELYVQKKLHEISKQIENRIIIKYSKIWRQRVLRKKQQRKALDNTPVWLSKHSLEECAKSLYSKEQDVVIQNMRTRKLNHIDSYEERNYLDPIEVEIYNGIKENAKILDIELTTVIFWKMVVSWPHMRNRILLGQYKKIMNEYLCPRDSSMDPIIKTYKPNSYETLNICIRHSEDMIHEDDLVGVDGIYFIITTDEDSKSVARRLTKAVLARQKLMPIPLYLVIFGNDTDPKNIEPTVKLTNLLNSGYLSEYNVHYEKTINESIVLELTKTAILWLTRNKSPPIPLEMNSLTEIIDTCLTDELWLRISGHASFNTNLLTALENPNFVINIYNEAVGHLIDMILDPESLMYTDFPSEFHRFLPTKIQLPCGHEYFDQDWKNEENREKIERTINSFSLPLWPFEWPISNTMELHKCIIRYCQKTLTSSNYPTMACSILNNICVSSNDEEMPNFVYIILEILKEKLRQVSAEVRVVYNKNHIKHFQTLPWWFKSNTLANYNNATQNEQRALQQLEEEEEEEEGTNEEPVEKKRRIQEETEILLNMVDKYNNSIENEAAPFESIIEQDHAAQLHNISEKIENILLQQTLSSRKLEDKLETALCEQDNDFNT